MDEFKCGQCGRDDIDTLYEGWFYTTQRLNPFAEGTASAGLLQFKRVCQTCLDRLKKLGLCECGTSKKYSEEYLDKLRSEGI